MKILGKKMTKEKTEEVKEESPQKDTIEVSKKDYKRMADKIKDLEQKQSVLLETADKKSMARYMRRHSKDQPKIVKLRRLNGKTVIGWKTEQNEVGKDENNRWYEKQVIKVFFANGSSRLIPYQTWIDSFSKFPCKRLGVRHDEEEDTVYLKLESLDEEMAGETYEVESKFVN